MRSRTIGWNIGKARPKKINNINKVKGKSNNSEYWEQQRLSDHTFKEGETPICPKHNKLMTYYRNPIVTGGTFYCKECDKETVRLAKKVFNMSEPDYRKYLWGKKQNENNTI